MRLTARDLGKIPHAEFRGREILARSAVKGISTDSRTTRPGDLFIALRGASFDGHRFVGDAFRAGAVAAAVEEIDPAQAGGNPVILVGNTYSALGALARQYRDRFSIPFIAVGGSNGKTTTKEMIANVLAEKYNVLATEGNLNNNIGVPMTLFRLNRKHEVAVVEIGTNHPGEIRELCTMLAPTHGVLTSIGREHLEFFGSLDGVAREEGELFAFLASGAGGTALVGADDPRITDAARAVKRKVTYGFRAPRASVRGRNVTLGGDGCASFEFRSAAMKRWQGVRLTVPGRHNAMNALSAAVAGIVFHVPPARIAGALESSSAPGRRMETLWLGGVTVLNDTYNANPDSAIAALETLASLAVRGKRIAVLGDMKELGSGAAAEHTRVGQKAAELGIDYLLTYGDLARHMHDGAGIPGALHYEGKNVLAEYIAELVTPGDAVLVKGSRSMHMEDIVAFLTERLRPARQAGATGTARGTP
jgi:UDP-N-acetylmuramoyl-tripeptide--D-alanyl-D-alanine ligase